MAKALSVGTVFSEEQAQATVERIADQLRTKKTPREVPLMIANIVSTFSVGIPSGLDLAVVAIALNGRLGEWKVKTQDERGNAKDFLRGVVGTDQPFQSCVSRCRETRTTNSIFSSSQVVVGGAKSVLLARLAATLIAAKLYKSLGLWTGVYNFRVQNVVTSFGLGYYLNLPYFYHHHSLYSTWSEAEFRGLTYKVGDATFVIFETGNAVLTGEKSFESLEAAYRTALPIFERYKRGAEKMYIEPSKLLKPEVKESEKHNSSKQRKEKLKGQTYKRVEEDYVERIRAANEAERKRVNPAGAAAEEAEQKSRPAKRRRVRYQQDPSNSDHPEIVTSEPHRIVQRQWKTQIALTPLAPFQPKYQGRQAPPTFALRKAMSKGSQLDAAKDQVKKERMKMENPPVHVQK